MSEILISLVSPLTPEITGVDSKTKLESSTESVIVCMPSIGCSISIVAVIAVLSQLLSGAKLIGIPMT